MAFMARFDDAHVPEACSPKELMSSSDTAALRPQTDRGQSVGLAPLNSPSHYFQRTALVKALLI